MTIKHKFVNPYADPPNATLVKPSNWNDDHNVTQLVSPQTTVTFSSTPTFDASLGNSFKLTLTGNVTSSTLSNAIAGQLLTFVIIQDSSGNHSFVWPTNVLGGVDITNLVSLPNQYVVQQFHYDGTNAQAITPGMIFP